MQTKSVLYAAVGAPVVAARKVSDKASALKGKVEEHRVSYGKTAEKTIDSWAVEGEKIVSKVSEGKVVEEISSKVDLDQAKEQVGKLRDQLEDMLDTWRHSFRPEKAEETETAEEKTEKAPAAKEPATKKPAAAKKPAAKKPAAAKTSAAKTTKSSTAAKTSSTKPTSEKKAS